MDPYAIAPLVATIAYIPLLITTASSRPWQKRHTLFILFLLSAISWSFVTYIYRSNLLPDFGNTFFKLTVIFFAVTAVQFHSFTSSFYPQGQKRWLFFAYSSLIPICIFVLLGYVTSDVYFDGSQVRSSYILGILLVSLPLLVIVARNLYVF